MKVDGNIFYIGDFDDSTEDEITIPLIREIQEQRDLEEGRLDLYINSFGGHSHFVGSLIELIELAKRDGIVVRTVVPALAWSAGSMLAIAGTPGERYISRSGVHMIHYGTSQGGAPSSPREAKRWAAAQVREFDLMVKHYKKYGNSSLPIDNEIETDGWTIPAEKCIKWGLADHYMTKFDINP